MTPVEFAWYIVNTYTSKSENGISPMKLQKLLYYTHVWSVVSGNKFVEMSFQKWQYGPVLPEVYHEFKKFGANAIVPNELEINFPKETEQFVEFVIENYVKYTALTLSALTHSETPWQITETSATISEETIYNYYSKMSFAKNFPIDYTKPYYPVETDLHYSFILDVKDPVPHSYPNYIVYKELEAKTKKEFSEFLQKILAF